MGSCANTYYLKRNQSELLLADRQSQEEIERYNDQVFSISRQIKDFGCAYDFVCSSDLDIERTLALLLCGAITVKGVVGMVAAQRVETEMNGRTVNEDKED